MSQTVQHAGVNPTASDAVEVARNLDVDPARGLTAAEAASRLASHGPNRLAAGKKEPAWRAFLRQYEDFMQVVLLVAAVVNQIVTGETGTTVVLAGLTVFNAVIGLRQEAKAEESVKALAQMMKTIARVRRDGQAVEIDAGELVPGDVVLVEAGNRVPADGRVSLAATLEIEEAALTGESLPVGKSTDPVPGRGRAARRPDLHGVHEHLGHPRPRRADRHRHRHGHRDRPHRRHAGQHRDQQDAAAEAAGRAVEDHRLDRRGRAGAGRAARPGPRRVVRHAVRHRRRAGGRRDPDRAAGRGDRAAVDGHPRDREAQRDRQAAAGGGDAGLDVGDLLGQDRHPDPEQDDRPGAGHPRPEPVHGLRRGLQHRRARSATSAASTTTSTRTCCRWCCAPTPCSTGRA